MPFGLYRISRMTIADPLGFVCFTNGPDPVRGAEVIFPSGTMTRGDVYMFQGKETARSDIPDADYYVVVHSGPFEELFHGLYGREVFIRGRIISIERTEVERKAVEIFGIKVPMPSGKSICFIKTVGAQPGTEIVDIESKLVEDNMLLNQEVSKLRGEKAKLEKELEVVKAQASEASKNYETCRSAMDRLYYELESRLNELEALKENLETLEKMRQRALDVVEKAVGKGLFKSEKDKLLEEIKAKLEELKREKEKL